MRGTKVNFVQVIKNFLNFNFFGPSALKRGTFRYGSICEFQFGVGWIAGSSLLESFKGSYYISSSLPNFKVPNVICFSSNLKQYFIIIQQFHIQITAM